MVITGDLPLKKSPLRKLPPTLSPEESSLPTTPSCEIKASSHFLE